MDLNYVILYVLGIIAVTAGLVYLVRYLRVKNYVTTQDLQFVGSLLNIGVEVLDELNLKSEKDLLKIATVVQDSINFAVGMFDSQEDVYTQACKYAYVLCEQLNIELTDNRKNIINDLIRVALVNKK